MTDFFLLWLMRLYEKFVFPRLCEDIHLQIIHKNIQTKKKRKNQLYCEINQNLVMLKHLKYIYTDRLYIKLILQHQGALQHAYNTVEPASFKKDSKEFVYSLAFER